MKKLVFFLSVLIRFPINTLRNNKISFSSRIGKNSKMRNSTIGNYTYIARSCIFNNAIIGNYCSIAPGVQIGGMEHSYKWHSMSTFISDKANKRKNTIIGHDVWIAAGSIIKQGITIGNGAVIGALTFVNKDVPPNSVVVGIPGKIKKKRMEDDLFDKIQKTKYWNNPPIKAKQLLNSIV